MTITVYVDRVGSWYTPFARDLVTALRKRGHSAALAHRAADILEGDLCFLLSCVRIVGPNLRARNRLNLVVHASALPLGKGFSPLAYQIAAGVDHIPLTMIEAVDAVDAGPVYMRSTCAFEGHELLPELREAVAAEIGRMVLAYVDTPNAYAPIPQIGESSWYPRRGRGDDELDPTRPLAEQFDRLRVVDNDQYPAWFNYLGHDYEIKITKKVSETTS